MRDTSERTSTTPSAQVEALRPEVAALVSAAVAGLLAGLACNQSGTPDPQGSGGAQIISSMVVADMTLDRFTADCDAQGGVVETHASCGGVNTCKGFSYDDATHVFSEHSCRGMNTCSGYSCVVPDDAS